MPDVLTRTRHKLAFFCRVVLLYYLRTCKALWWAVSMSVRAGGQMRNTRKCWKVWQIGLVAGWVLLLAANLSAQGIYATLTGVVSDPSQAVVANAKATLTDTRSGSAR